MHKRANFPEGLKRWSSRNTRQGAIVKDEDVAQGIPEYGIAGRTWEAAFMMSEYMENPEKFTPANPIVTGNDKPRVVLDVGSGTGYSALSMALQMRPEDHVILSDLKEVCPLLERNVQSFKAKYGCKLPRIHVRALAWGDLQAGKDVLDNWDVTHVTASDLVYFPFLYEMLMQTLVQMTSQGAMLVMSYNSRDMSREQSFWDSFGYYFDFEVVFHNDGPRLGQENHGYVFVAQALQQTRDAVRRGDQMEDLMENESDKFERFLQLQIDVL